MITFLTYNFSAGVVMNEVFNAFLQLSTDHAIGNENELIRLSNLGLDVENIRLGPKFRNHESTRCIGDYTVKGGYKEFDILR